LMGTPACTTSYWSSNVWLVQFDDQYEVVHAGVPIKDVPLLTSETYVPRAMTALHDAMGRTINDVGARLASMPEEDRPGKVLVVVITDGHENASKEFTSEKVLEMVNHQRSAYSWEFIFMAADERAFADAPHLGVPVGNVMLFEANAGGVQRAYSVSSRCATSYRSGTGDNENLVE